MISNELSIIEAPQLHFLIFKEMRIEVFTRLITVKSNFKKLCYKIIL